MIRIPINEIIIRNNRVLVEEAGIGMKNNSLSDNVHNLTSSPEIEKDIDKVDIL